MVLEAAKLAYDWLKNLTTLSTATILISAALIERVFSTPGGVWLLYVALLSFLFTVIGSTYCMFGIVELMTYQSPSEDSSWVNILEVVVFTPTAVVAAIVATLLSFMVGLIFVVIFVLLNIST